MSSESYKKTKSFLQLPDDVCSIILLFMDLSLITEKIRNFRSEYVRYHVTRFFELAFVVL